MIYIIGTIVEKGKRLVILEEVDSEFKPTGNRLTDQSMNFDKGELYTDPEGHLILEIKEKKERDTEYEELQAEAKKLGIPANQSKNDLRAAIQAADKV